MDADELAAMKERKRAEQESVIRNLRPPIKPREFILTMGVGGTGKSTAILEVARMCPSDTFYCLDSELRNFDRLLATAFTDLTNVETIPVEDWSDWQTQIPKIGQTMGRDDWLCVDSSTPTWDAVQAWFVEKIHGEDIDEWFISKRIQSENLKKGGAEDKGFAALSGGDGDWQVINKTYFKHFYNALLKVPGHIYMTAEQAEIGKKEDKDTKSAYGPIGFKPKGQKRLGHVPMTVLWLTKSGTGAWRMTTVKDRGRRELDDERLENFASDYLVDVAGWKFE